VKRDNDRQEEELIQCHMLERKRLPKIFRSDAKTRTLMFKESLRISYAGPPVDDKDRLRQVRSGGHPPRCMNISVTSIYSSRRFVKQYRLF